jgi:hypothetical protein
LRTITLPSHDEKVSMTGFSNKTAEGIFEPGEIADLGEIFQEACRRTTTAPDTEAAQMLAKRLLAATRFGVKDRDKLLRLVGEKAAV